jgi:LPS export ABC transporter protein LptC/lipopolysaccharide transport protein LptA
MSRFYKRAGALVLAVLFLILVVEIVIMAPRDLNDNKAQSETTEQADISKDDKIQQQMDGVHVVESKNDQKEWELWADRATGFRADQDLTLNNVKAIFFGDNGVEMTVTGLKGRVEPKTKNMNIEGSVVTRSNNGYVFKTESVNYRSDSRILTSPTAVEVTGPKDNLGRALFVKGDRMQADLGQGILNIDQNVRAQKTVQNSKKMAIQADKVALNAKSKAVQFSGNVQINVDGVKVTGPDAVFRYDTKSDLLKSVELEGGIKVSDVNKWATADKLNIFLEEDKYVFKGRPRVFQDDDELTGDEIVFLNGGKKVQVKNAKVKVSKDRLENEN